jgi:SNF2 family DNA or RNA helicase
MTLAPHRTVTNLARLSKARRTELLDEAVQRDEGIIVVNYEIWRQDKDVLAKLMGWQPDTMAADEAHVMKNIRTAFFRDVFMLTMVDNLCPECGGLLKGLYEPGPRGTRKVPRPCESCGWRIGDPESRRYANPLEHELRTKSVKHVMLTTGTPILNSPEDLFPLLHFCDPILFPNAKEFLAVYCTHNYHSGKWEFRGGALKHLKPLISGRFLQRTKEDVGIELPARRVHVVAVDLDETTHPLQYRTIRQLTKAAMILLESGQKAVMMHLITLIMRKRQANVWPGGIEIKDNEGNVIFSVGEEVQESAKLDAALEILRWAEAQGRRTVVFSQFKTALAELERRVDAAGIRVTRLDGDTPKRLRDQIKSNFYRALGETPKWDAVLANYATGGVGLNLTSCTVTIILDEEWNPGKRDQAYDRTHRIGQEEESDVFVLRMPRTIDVWMANTIHRKEQLVDGFTGTMKGSETELTAEALAAAIESGEVL